MSDRADWAKEQVTLELVRKLREDRQHFMELWAAGSHTGDSADKTLQLNSKAIGQVQAIDEILNWIEGDEADESGDLRTPGTD